MKLSSAIQEALVALILFDETPGGAKVVSGMLPASIYDAYYRDIAAEGISYLEKYGKPAGEHTLDIIDSLKARKPDDAAVFDRIYNSLRVTKESINREYVIGQASAFAQHQRLRTSLVKAVEAIQANTSEAVIEAEKILQDGLSHTFELFDKGVEFSDVDRSLRFLDREDITTFPTGIPQLDSRSLGPARKKLHVVGAATGGGKSWWLVHLAKMALTSRVKTLYVTLEMDADEVMGRVCQNFFSITKRKQDVKLQKFVRKDDGSLDSFAEVVIDDRPSLDQDDIRDVLTKKITPFKQKPRFIIKGFPTGQLTIRALKAYLSALEASANFIPDLLIVDYADLFDIDPKNKRLELDKIYVDLRGIGVEKNIAVATATQLNADGGQARTATKFHAAEAKSKIHHADVFITYNQTQDEYELGLARLFVAKGRSDEDKFSVLITQAYKMGQFAVDSVMMSRTYWDNFTDDDDDHDADDDP